MTTKRGRDIADLRAAIGIGEIQAYYHVRNRELRDRSGKFRSINLLK